MAAYCHKPENKEIWVRIAEMWINLANLTQKRDGQILHHEKNPATPAETRQAEEDWS